MENQLFANVDDILTPEEAMKLLKVSRTVIYKMLKENAFPGTFRVGYSIRIPKYGLIAYIQNQQPLSPESLQDIDAQDRDGQ